MNFMTGAYAIAMVLTALGLWLAVRAVRTPQIGARAGFSLLAVGAGIIAAMAWMIPRWAAEAARQAEVHNLETGQVEAVYVGWDLRSMVHGMPGWIWVTLIATFGALMVFGEPRWRARLLRK